MRIGFHNYLPAPSPVTRYNHPPPRNDVPMVGSCRFKHVSKIDLCKPPVLHSFQKVGTEFPFPIPPQGPFTRSQKLSLPKLVSGDSMGFPHNDLLIVFLFSQDLIHYG